MQPKSTKKEFPLSQRFALIFACIFFSNVIIDFLTKSQQALPILSLSLAILFLSQYIIDKLKINNRIGYLIQASMIILLSIIIIIVGDGSLLFQHLFGALFFSLLSFINKDIDMTTGFVIFSCILLYGSVFYLGSDTIASVFLVIGIICLTLFIAKFRERKDEKDQGSGTCL